MTDQLISLIVPVSNLRELLPRCLDSLLAQTHPHMEIIVVDDGSTDGTGAVLDDYAQRHSPIRPIHISHSGVTAARLRGIREAHGQWIGFMDADDRCEPEMYARLLANALAHDAQISHCGYRMVYPSGRTEDYHGTGRKVVRQGLEGCRDLLEADFVEPGLWNKLYRRALFEGLDAWMDSDIRVNEDLLMNFYLFRRAEISVYEDFCPYHYILRRSSATQGTRQDHHLTDPLRVLHILLEQTQDMPELYRPVYRRLVWGLVNTASLPLDAAPVKEARRELRQRLWHIFTGNACGGKLKLMALWTALWPQSYGIAHRLYSRATGLDKKYKA